MNKNEIAYCKRCNVTFECNANDISNCQCNEITLSEKTKTFMGETNYNCLCANCLTELESLVNDNHNLRRTLNPQNLLEGVHFYKEDGLFVFTELYHYLKGSCCGNNCKHCAYGNKK